MPVRVIAVLVVALGTFGSIWLANDWDKTTTRQRDERLDRMADTRTTALHAERALILSSTFVSRGDFRSFVRELSLDKDYPGMQGIGWQAYVPGAQRDAFEARARKDGAPGFTIKPAGRRSAYYVVLYAEPGSRFGPTLGLDTRASESLRGELELARDTGQTTISDKVIVGVDLKLPAAGHRTAFALYVPIYRNGVPTRTVAERRAAFLGWAFSPFEADGFLDGALTSIPDYMGMELYDSSAQPGNLIATYPAGFHVSGPQQRTGSFVIGGRTWVLRYSSLPGSPTVTDRTIPPSLVLAAGLAGSLLLGALLWLFAQLNFLYQQVGRLARTDALTGVANRRTWDEEVPRELARATRAGWPVSIALIDLDHFKSYNDSHGHQAGDRLLKEAAAAWQGTLRRTDLLARYGGEEFAVLLPACGPEDAETIAERLRVATPEGTCSIGVAVWTPDGSDSETGTKLVERADRALYTAKATGRDAPS